MQQPLPASSTPPHAFVALGARAFGVLVAAAGGFAAYWLISASPLLTLVGLFTCVLAGFIAALLWRTWWALLLLPAVLWLGAVASEVFFRILTHLAFSGEFTLDLIVIDALPAMVGAAAGTELGMRIEQRFGR